MAADRDDDAAAGIRPREGEHVCRVAAGHPYGRISSILENVGVLAANAQELTRECKLHTAVLPTTCEFRESNARLKRGRAMPEVDRPPVVRIDERQIPKLSPLVEVRNSGERQLERELGEAVECADERRALREAAEASDEFARALRIEDCGDETGEGFLVRFVRVGPARLLLALARGFQ